MKTRTIKELLILLRDFLPTNIKSTERLSGSLCFSIDDLFDDDVINIKESEILEDYIHAHKPHRVGNYKFRGVGGFWWKYKSLAPRMEFLNNLISEL